MKEIDKLLPYIRLQFNIEHPDLDDCYLFGYTCAKRGLDESENPFPIQSKECLFWQEGFWDALYEEKPLFEEASTSEPKEPEKAINDSLFQSKQGQYLLSFLKITGALAATIIVGYQVFDLVA